MFTYRVTFVLDGKRYAEEVSATCSIDARRLIQGRYPGAVIWNVERVG